MAKWKLRGKDLRKIGFDEGPVIGMTITVVKRHFKHHSPQMVLKTLKAVRLNPEAFIGDPILEPIATTLMGKEKERQKEQKLLAKPQAYRVFGQEHIAQNAQEQMNVAMRLPIATAGALMPDAHHGYGLPIGGVLATNNAVIPYGVGVDIGCRMCLTLYDMAPAKLQKDRKLFKKWLGDNSRFGFDTFADPMPDPILDHSAFREIPVVKRLRQKAIQQIGSSGSGNHFVEFGVVVLEKEDVAIGLPPGQYLGLLSHSGSRGLGATIANHYTKLAMEACLLPKEAKHLAWLNLDSELGQEYWIAMNLAGDYASACHRHIYQRMSKAMGVIPLAIIENHHNFAWKEKGPDGQEYIVHRKGATPAGNNELGIIPGSMTAPAFVVRGKGYTDSLSSASHGAGRQMSRRKAKASFTKKQLREELKKWNVDLLGGDLDEAPFAYKDIHTVMAHQTNMVDVLGTFLPQVVRMDG
ncbi:MAG: RtcB family protein [Saprospiraceae bacterium]|nr:RtcB family protein [Saprospiraceae bacterium]